MLLIIISSPNLTRNGETQGKMLVRRVLGLREGKMTRKKERGRDGEFVEKKGFYMFFFVF
jgi:hypothetical protein